MKKLLKKIWNTLFVSVTANVLLIAWLSITLATVWTFPKTLSTIKWVWDKITTAEWNDVADAVNVLSANLDAVNTLKTNVIVDWSNNVWIWTSTPAEKLEVEWSTYLSQTWSKLIMRSPDWTCSTCGPDNWDNWVCVSSTCQ